MRLAFLAVLHVLRVITKIQMVRINARLVIALVQNHQSIRNRATMNEPRQSRCFLSSFLAVLQKKERTITMLKERAAPIPAAVTFGEFLFRSVEVFGVHCP